MVPFCLSRGIVVVVVVVGLFEHACRRVTEVPRADEPRLGFFLSAQRGTETGREIQGGRCCRVEPRD